METKLKEIYEAMSNKELTMGCRIESDTYKAIWTADPKHAHLMNGESLLHKDYEIIGHPVMIGNYLHWIYNIAIDKGIDVKEAIGLWEHKELPIESQSQQCQDYIHSLIN